MNYEELENSIIARLSALELAGIDVIALPETDDVLKPSSGGKVTVAYLSSEFDSSVTTDIVSQPENITFQIIIQSRKLRGNIGIYNIVKSIQQLLLGWQTVSSGKITYSKVVYDAHENGIWTYHVDLTTVNLALEQPDDVPVVIATQITLVDEYENQIIIPGDMDNPSPGVVTYNGPFKKYRRTGITEGIELTDIISEGHQLFQFTARNDSDNAVQLKLGTTLGGNEVLEAPMNLNPGEINTATIVVQYPATSAMTLFLSSPDWNDASITILVTTMEGLS